MKRPASKMDLAAASQATPKQKAASHAKAKPAAKTKAKAKTVPKVKGKARLPGMGPGCFKCRGDGCSTCGRPGFAGQIYPRQSCMEGTLWKAKVAFQTKFHCFAGMGANTRQSCETQWSQSIGLSAAMEKTAALCLCMPKASWLPMCHGLCHFAAIQQPCGFPWSMPQCVRMLFLCRIYSHAAIV